MRRLELADEDPLLRVAAVARLTGLQSRTVRAEADCGQLPCVRVGLGRHRFFQWSAVQAYCRRLGIRPSGRPATAQAVPR